MASPTHPEQEPAAAAPGNSPFGAPEATGSPEVTEPAPATEAARVEEPRRIPSQEELERIAVDVRIRRRPRYGVFIVTGMVLAAIIGYLLATSVPQDQHVNWGSTVWVTTIGSAVLGVILGAGAGVFADWLSRRK